MHAETKNSKKKERIVEMKTTLKITFNFIPVITYCPTSKLKWLLMHIETKKNSTKIIVEMK